MEITADNLLAIQSRLKYLLSELDLFCQKYGIKYTLEGGTALGASRHGDIIPWDDDIDVRMDKKEYEKFCKAYEQNGSSTFFLQRHKSEHNYFKEFAKIRDLHSFIREDNLVTYSHNGLFVDIFVFENAYPSLVQIAHYLYRPLFSLSYKPLDKMKVLSFLANCYYYFIQIFVFLFRGISRVFKAKTYSYTYGSNLNPYKLRYTNWMFEGDRKMKFGDKEYPVPYQIHDYLVAHYGTTYMTPPPEAARTPHHVRELVIDPIEQ